MQILKKNEMLYMDNAARTNNRAKGINYMMAQIGTREMTRKEIAAKLDISLCMVWDWMNILIKSGKAEKYKKAGSNDKYYRITDPKPFTVDESLEVKSRGYRAKRVKLPDFDKTLLAWMGYATSKPKRGERIDEGYYETAKKQRGYVQMPGLSSGVYGTGIQSTFNSAYGM